MIGLSEMRITLVTEEAIVRPVSQSIFTAVVMIAPRFDHEQQEINRTAKTKKRIG